jgi:hypothetical protein
VNKGNQPFEYDQVNIVCPVYAPGTHESDAEKYIIYNVSIYIILYYYILHHTVYNYHSSCWTILSKTIHRPARIITEAASLRPCGDLFLVHII